jgi:SAM-dependent methyltransferase
VQHRSRPHPNAGRSYSYRLIEHDVEAAPLPLADGDFSLVIVWRDLERMRCDPEFALYELNRVTVPGGTLSLVADNAISLRATHALVCGDPAPLRIHDSSRESRWRLFTPDEIEDLARGTGWRIDTLTTIVPAAPAQWPWWKRWLFKRWVGGMRSGSGRPDPCWNNFILASATKVSGPTRSYPAWLYSDERIRQLKIEMIELVSRCAENSRPAA